MKRILISIVALFIAFTISHIPPAQTQGPEQQLPKPEDFPPANPGCRNKGKLSPIVLTPEVEFPKTFTCELHITFCGNVRKFRSNVRNAGTGMCSDYWAAHDALLNLDVCCDGVEVVRDPKCDNKGACDAVAKMQKLIAEYDASSKLIGSFREFMNKFDPLLQDLSEALACRFNQNDVPDEAEALKAVLGQLLRHRNSFKTLNDTSRYPSLSTCVSRSLNEPVPAAEVNACADLDTLNRIKSTLNGLCPKASKTTPKPSSRDCKELSNGLLDGLTTLFDKLDDAKWKNLIGSGDAYDQVADGIDGGIKELESAAKEIEGTGGTGAQQYKDIQEKLGKLKKLLDVWKKMKAASCLPPEIEELLRRLAQEKRAGSEYKATCTELCGATADWYVEISGLAPQRGTFFKVCTLSCF
jgi:hypothetical protein